ncbi:MAG: HTH-type transcriptional regulator GlnR [Candidatus Scalindua rubra]|uniref:HTH-type transcriptional regulator GlnR n=1 Tax=Candidatus Scalindua rubra TaxID=1872076 RepID=A0A1E3XE31_9BACT|nr:MAG: HTH-type transcriptional regulator GlnR [Candidatus Scalindua rubra]
MVKEIDPNKSVFPISVAAEILDVNPRTLRIYEEKGLIKPSRNDGNRRLYSLKDISLLEYVHYLIQIKRVNAAGVRELLSVLNTLPQDNRDELTSRVEKTIEKLPKDKLEMYKKGDNDITEDLVSE